MRKKIALKSVGFRVILFISICVTLFSCAEATVNSPKGSKEVPAQVVVKDVINQAGKAIVRYDLPDDSNFKYVKAVFSPSQDKQSEVRASFFVDSLVLEGFQKGGDYPVLLYSVSYGEVCSDPISVTVSPSTPNYLRVFESISFTEDFGGFRCVAENPDKEQLWFSIEQYSEETLSWEKVTEQVASAETITIVGRGLAPIPTHFRLRVEDMFGNESDYGEWTVTPLEEIMCDKSKFSVVYPPDEYELPIHKATTPITLIWDGNLNQNPGFQTKINELLTWPVAFTLDLGAKYKLSRFEKWSNYVTSTKYDYRYEKYFNGCDIKDFEVYGAADLDMENPLFDEAGNLNPNWHLLWSGTVKRPSGLTNNSSIDLITDEEEYNYVNRVPLEFEFNQDAPAVRYVKFRVSSTWGGKLQIHIVELSIYGAEKE